ncbi:MAG: trigger factor [Chloroflexota bacterium]
MSLTITTQEDEQRQLTMTIEVAESRVTSEMKKIAKSLAKQVRVPGFRPGKAPFRVIVNRFGEANLRVQAVEDMMNDIILEALTQEEIAPYARPSIENIEVETPVKLELLVPLEPSITLGDYRSVRREVEVPPVSDEAVEEAIQGFIENKTVTEEVDRSSELGDLIKLAGKAELDPVESEEKPEDSDEDADGDEDAAAYNENLLFDNQDGLEFLLDPEATFTGTNFVEQLVGKTVGESLSFKFAYADDYEVSDFAGREATVEVDILQIQSRTVPELTDELVAEDGYESVDDFKVKTRENLEEEALNTFKNETLDEWVKDLSGDAALVYSPGVIEQELDERLENFKKQISSYGWEWDAYLEMQQESEENIKELWREDVSRDVENALLMREFFDVEKIQVNEEEIDALVEERMERFGDMDENIRESMKEVMRSPDSIRRMSTEVLSDKAYERVVAILSGDAPDLSELEEAEEVEEAELEEGVEEEESDEALVVETTAEENDSAEETETVSEDA